MDFIKVADEQCRSRSWFNDEKKILFDPPVYEQRYLATSRILSHEKYRDRIKSIVEFGCAEMKFFVYIKNGLSQATSIHQVDIDEELLTKCKTRINPMIIEHLHRRETQLTARIWAGSVAVTNPNFIDVDAVVAIEL